jgi:hypothetical protein
VTRRVIYCVHRAPEWLDAAQRLADQLGWSPVVWVTRPENHDAVGARFPGALRHRRFDANRGLAPQGLEHYLRRSLSLDELAAALPYEPVAMDILNRVDMGRRFSYQERQRLYYRLLAYWLAVLRAQRADCVVFSAPPHAIGEYMLYAAAQVEKLAVRIFRLTALHGYHLVCDSLETLPAHLLDAYRLRLSRGRTELRSELAVALDALRSAPGDYKPDYAALVDRKEARYAPLKERLRELDRNGRLENAELRLGAPLRVPVLGGLLARDALGRRPHPQSADPLERHWKAPDRPLDGPMLTRGEIRNYRDWSMLMKLRLERRYRALCGELPAAKPYVYLAMHYQPERTTSPDGGRFSDQYAVAAVLAEALPTGWALAVKEHPSQFKYSRTGEMSRYLDYYDDLAALPNVVLLAPEAPSAALTDGARAAATVTGAVGWEALVRGKPVLCFGAAWYGACKGAFVVQSAADARAALQEVEAGLAPGADEVRMYAGAIQDVGRRVYHDPARAVPLDEPLADALAGLLANFERLNRRELREQAG